MLILTRKPDEAIILTLATGERIEVIIAGVSGNQVKVGLDAPEAVEIMRKELLDHFEMPTIR
ncbi:MAG: carbon storage regulator [Gammaproteobacteria bacterium]|nr:carbon storage regulator [Gammaproteobacteria bacterium]